MNTQQQGLVLLDRAGVGFVQILDDGRVLAGYYRETAKPYDSAELAETHYRDAYNFSGSEASWTIADTLSRYIEQKDEGR